MSTPFNGDYFTRRGIFILEGKEFQDETQAKHYVVNQWGMSNQEANRYLLRLKNEFIARLRARS